MVRMFWDMELYIYVWVSVHFLLENCWCYEADVDWDGVADEVEDFVAFG